MGVLSRNLERLLDSTPNGVKTCGEMGEMAMSTKDEGFLNDAPTGPESESPSPPIVAREPNPQSLKRNVLGCKVWAETVEAIDAIAHKRGLTRSELLREILDRYIAENSQNEG